ncbi:DUF2993 domain-containing protein [Clavibacter sp. DM3]|nr:DUF2993 domain-containing protein [Clavibacter zhangzhiyongii]
MAGRFLGTEVFEAPERRDPREARRRRRGPRGGAVVIWLLVLAVIGVGLAFGLRIIDQTVRGVAEDQAEQRIAEQLPGRVSGKVNVSIQGDWVIPQLIRGTLDRVVLDGPNLQADGTPFQAHIVATDVPTDQERTVGDVVATVSMDQAPASALLAKTAGTPADLRFGDGTLGYSGSTRVLGITFRLRRGRDARAAGPVHRGHHARRGVAAGRRLQGRPRADDPGDPRRHLPRVRRAVPPRRGRRAGRDDRGRARLDDGGVVVRGAHARVPRRHRQLRLTGATSPVEPARTARPRPASHAPGAGPRLGRMLSPPPPSGSRDHTGSARHPARPPAYEQVTS